MFGEPHFVDLAPCLGCELALAIKRQYIDVSKAEAPPIWLHAGLSAHWRYQASKATMRIRWRLPTGMHHDISDIANIAFSRPPVADQDHQSWHTKIVIDLPSLEAHRHHSDRVRILEERHSSWTSTMEIFGSFEIRVGSSLQVVIAQSLYTRPSHLVPHIECSHEHFESVERASRHSSAIKHEIFIFFLS